MRGSFFKARGNRIIEVNHQLQHYKQKARKLLTSEEGIKHRGRRCIEPEAVFGQTKYNKAYKRFRHFGKDKVNMDFAFFAIAFNIGKMCKKNNLKELKTIMEVLLVTFRCSIEVYISYWKPNKSFYYEISNIAAVNNELCGSLSKGEQKRGCVHFDTPSFRTMQVVCP